MLILMGFALGVTATLFLYGALFEWMEAEAERENGRLFRSHRIACYVCAIVFAALIGVAIGLMWWKW
jgi:hypothetical protein